MGKIRQAEWQKILINEAIAQEPLALAERLGTSITDSMPEEQANLTKLTTQSLDVTSVKNLQRNSKSVKSHLKQKLKSVNKPTRFLPTVMLIL